MATGHLFFVQLKATDQAAAEIRVRLSRRVLDYYATLVLPVLLVIYHTRTSTLYARWVCDNSRLPLRKSASVTVRMSSQERWDAGRLPAIAEELSSLAEAARLGNRELRIQRYYDQKRSINPADKPTGPRHPVRRFQRGNRLLHGVFGSGTVDEESDSYLFVRFDEDDMARKFLPGDTWEFTRVGSAHDRPSA